MRVVAGTGTRGFRGALGRRHPRLNAVDPTAWLACVWVWAIVERPVTPVGDDPAHANAQRVHIQRAIAGNAPRHPWHLRQRRHCGIRNLQNLKGPVGFESHPLRQQHYSIKTLNSRI
jgi:hypothetical protein